jgi:hypothetical protein
MDRRAASARSRIVSSLAALALALGSVVGIESQLPVEPAQASGISNLENGPQFCRSVAGDGALEATRVADKDINGSYTSLASRTGDNVTGLTVTPLFSKRMYVDPGRNFDATYVAYRLTATSSGTLNNLTVTLDGFEGSVIRPVSAEDNTRFIGNLASGTSKTVFFMLRANATSTADQTHRLRVLQRDATTGGQNQISMCNTAIKGVQRSLAASANKVTSITTSGALTLGNTFTVTVNGAPGKVGQGNDIDGSVFAMSPASNSSWPTRAIRLEGVSLVAKGFNGSSTKTSCESSGATWSNSAGTATFTDTLVVRKFGSCANTTKQTYTATYTFRVVGFSAVNPKITPLASIASGTQVKYTGSLPTSETTIPLTDTETPLNVKKTYVDSDVVGDNVNVRYRLTAEIPSDFAFTGTLTVDQLRDLPQDSALTVSAATFTDATRTSATSITKTNLTENDLIYWLFAGPFGVTKTIPLILNYTVSVPKPAIDTTIALTNEAFAYSNGTIFGSGSTITGIKITVSSDGTVVEEPTTKKAAQTINFEPPSAVGNSTTTVLLPTADSGLAVTLESITPAICLVSIFDGVWELQAVAEGTCTVKATQLGNTVFEAAPIVTRNITVKPGQVITFEAGSFNGTTAGSTANVTVRATSKLPVSLLSIDDEVCNAAVLTAHDATTGDTTYRVTAGAVTGACILEATQDGDATWGPAPKRDILLGVGKPQVIDFSSPLDGAVFTYPTTSSFNAVATAKDGSVSGPNTNNPVTYKSLTRAVCTVRQLFSGDSISSGLSNGVTTVPIDLVGTGTCVIVASQDGLNDIGESSGFAAAPDVTHSFTINGSGSTPQQIIFDPVTNKTYGADAFDAFAQSEKTDGVATGLLVTITSLTPEVCSVSESTLVGSWSKVSVRLLGAGSCTLRGANGGNNTYAAKTTDEATDRTFEVDPKQLTLSGLSATKAYDGNDSVTFTGAAQISGVVSGDGLAEISLIGTPTGNYPEVEVGDGPGKNITVGGLSLSGTKLASYALPASYVIPGAITPRPITITLASQAVLPSAAVECFAKASISSGTLASGESFTSVTCSGIPARNEDGNLPAGSYTITPSTAAVAKTADAAVVTTANYAITYVAGTLTVTTKTVPELLTTNLEVFYGDLILETEAAIVDENDKVRAKSNDSVIPGKLKHKKNGVEITAADLDVGEFTLTVEFEPDDENAFSVATAQRTVKINPRPLRAKLTIETREYNGSRGASSSGDIELEPTIADKDILDGDKLNVTLTGSPTLQFDSPNAGTGKSVAVSGLSLAGSKSHNYELVATSVTGTILPRQVSLTAISKSKLRGAADPTPEFERVAGSFAPSEDSGTIGLTIARVGAGTNSGEAPGPHTIQLTVASPGSSQARDNYEVTLAPGTLYISDLNVDGTDNGDTFEVSKDVVCNCENLKEGTTATVTLTNTIDSQSLSFSTAGGFATFGVFSTVNFFSTNFTVASTLTKDVTVASNGTCPLLELKNVTEGEYDVTITGRSPNNDPLTQNLTINVINPTTNNDTGSGGQTQNPDPGPLPTLNPSPTPTPTPGPTAPIAMPSPTSAPAPAPRPAPAASPTPAATQAPAAQAPAVRPTPVPTQPKADSVERSSVRRVSLDQLARESVGGFAPSAGVTVEVLGSRTGARFIVTSVDALDAMTLIEAIKNSISAQAADFFSITSVRISSTPSQPASWSNEQSVVADDYFSAAGLARPMSLAELDFSKFTRWIEVSSRGAGYVPGSTVFLTLTSKPLVIAQGTVDNFGNLELSGSMPIEFLDAGEHRVRLVGIRSLGGITVDENGEVIISPETLAEIKRFDLGTQATVRMGGLTPEGDYLNAIRVVPLDAIAPWWALWFILAGFIIAAAARRRHYTDTRLKLGLAASLNIAAAIPAVIIGWVSTVTLVTWVGLALGLVAMVATVLLQPSDKAVQARQ